MENRLRGPIGRLVASAGARIVILPVSGGAALLTTRIVTSEYDVSVYGIIALAASLPFLVPMMDLGVGAAVTNAAAGLPENSATFRLTLRRAQRTLMAVGALVALVAVSFAPLGRWSQLLNLPNDHGYDWGMAGAVVLIALAVPGSLGARILLGVRRNALVVVVQGATSVVNLAVVAILLAAGAPVSYLVAGSTAGVLVTNWLLTIVALRQPVVRNTRVQRTDVDAPGRVAIWSTALPMIVVSLALPITFQSDRLVLGWVADLHEVAIYSAAAMVFLPLLSVVQTAGRSLWGDFAEARHRGTDVRQLFLRSVRVSAGIGIIGASGLLIFGPGIASWATSGILDVPFLLFVAFAMIVLLQAVQQPSGMYLTDARGLRFQALTTVVTAVASLVLSIFLGMRVGAIGPVIGTCVALALFHVAPCFWFSILQINSREMESKETIQEA